MSKLMLIFWAVSFFVALTFLNQCLAQIQNPVVSCSDNKRKLLCLPQDYSKFDLPYRNEYNVIDIGIEISDVLKIDDKDYSITFSLYFNVQWSEPRLNLSTEFFDVGNNTGDDELLVPVNLELIHDLWLPNIFIYNLKTFKVIDVLSKLAGLWINSKKEIYYSQATHITFICPMLFDSFPLDIQVCKFQVGSYSYDMTKMIFRVSKLTFIQKQSIVLDYSIGIRNLKDRDKIFLAGALGNYSLAGFEMNLQRHVMSYIITYYLPSGLFVVVSWISFLIPPDIVPGRMALLITLFLVLINIFNNITTNSPKAEGLTAIEIWMLACILFVFGALIEYALILFKKQKVNKYGIPSQSALSHKASISAQKAANQDQQNFQPGGIVTTRLLPQSSMNYSHSTGSTCCMNQLGFTHQDDQHEYYMGGHLLMSPGEYSQNAYPTMRCDLGCCSNSLFHPNNSRPTVFWQHQNISAQNESTQTHPQQPNCTGKVGSADPARVTPPSRQSNSCQLSDTAQNGLKMDLIEAGATAANTTEMSQFQSVNDQLANEVNITERLIPDPSALGGSADIGTSGIGISGHSVENGSNTTAKIIHHPGVFFRTKEQGCRHHQRIDSLKRRRRQSTGNEKQYSTWHDKYAKIDRFFLICSPVLFGIFNLIYWGYFYIWNEYFKTDDGEEYF